MGFGGLGFFKWLYKGCYKVSISLYSSNRLLGGALLNLAQVRTVRICVLMYSKLRLPSLHVLAFHIPSLETLAQMHHTGFSGF